MKRIAKILVLQFVFSLTLFSQSEEFGIASYYSDKFQGKPTASGELYDKNKLTAAHKTYPFGTIIKVTRLDNKKSVQVTVNDRGPFISGRVVEVSMAAANRLDLVTDGSARVKVEVVSEKTGDAAIAAKSGEKPKSYEGNTPKVETPKAAETPKGGSAANATSPAAADDKNDKKTKAAEKKEAAAALKAEEKKSKTAVNESPKGTEAKAVLVKGSDYQSFDLYQIELKRPEKAGFGVQVAALSSQDALFRKIADLQGDWFSNILVSIEQGPKNEMMYKVILGPFPDDATAQSYKTSLKKNKKLEGFVVDLSTLKQGK